MENQYTIVSPYRLVNLLGRGQSGQQALWQHLQSLDPTKVSMENTESGTVSAQLLSADFREYEL